MEGRTAAPSIRPTGSYALMTPLIGLALLAVGIVFLWQGPDRYSALKGVHVAFAVLWVGGGATLTIPFLVFCNVPFHTAIGRRKAHSAI